jgi:tetratricopeptide (TPR) repeat protein
MGSILAGSLLICVAILQLLACGGKKQAERNPAYNHASLQPFNRAIDKDSTKAEPWYQRGLALHRLKQDSLALEDLYRAARIDTNQGEYASAIGDILFEHKDLNNAIKWMSRALRHNPRDPRAHLKVAKLNLFLKEYPAAFLEINTVLRQDAYNPEAYFLKGLIYKDIKDTDKAISSFQTAISVAPDYRDAYIQLGTVYNEKGSNLGVQYLNNAFRLDTTDVFPIYAIGMFYQEQGQLEQAKAQYARCLEYDRQYADALFATGFILMQQDSLEKSRRQFDLVTKSDPANPAAYFNRGLCSEMLGRKEEAIADYRQALTFDQDYDKAKEALKRLGA